MLNSTGFASPVTATVIGRSAGPERNWVGNRPEDCASKMTTSEKDAPKWTPRSTYWQAANPGSNAAHDDESRSSPSLCASSFADFKDTRSNRAFGPMADMYGESCMAGSQDDSDGETDGGYDSVHSVPSPSPSEPISPDELYQLQRGGLSEDFGEFLHDSLGPQDVGASSESEGEAPSGASSHSHLATPPSHVASRLMDIGLFDSEFAEATDFLGEELFVLESLCDEPYELPCPMGRGDTWMSLDDDSPLHSTASTPAGGGTSLLAVGAWSWWSCSAIISCLSVFYGSAIVRGTVVGVWWLIRSFF